MLLYSLDQTLLEFSIVHWKDGLLPVQVDLKMRAFAGFEDRSLLREPTPELFARHFCIINNIVYIGKRPCCQPPPRGRFGGRRGARC